MKVSDEMIMAYVDDELDATTRADVERLIAQDRDLADRAEMFRATRRLVRTAFGPELTQAPSARLVEATAPQAETSPQPEGNAQESARIIAFPGRRTLLAALPVAAGLAVAFMLGGYWLGQSGPAASDLLGPSGLARTLGDVPAGESRMVSFAGEDVTLSTDSAYRVSGGVCRLFHLAGPSSSIRGVGCARGDADWTIDLAVAGPSADAFAPASAGLVESIDAYLDSLEAEPLSPQDDAAFRQ